MAESKSTAVSADSAKESIASGASGGRDFQTMLKDLRAALDECREEQLSLLEAEFGALGPRLESIVLRYAFETYASANSTLAAVQNVSIPLPASRVVDVPAGSESQSGAPFKPSVHVHYETRCEFMSPTPTMKPSNTEESESFTEVAKQIEEKRVSEMEQVQATGDEEDGHSLGHLETVRSSGRSVGTAAEAISRMMRGLSLYSFEERPTSWPACAVAHPVFHMFTTILILSNAVFVGWGVEKQIGSKWCQAAAPNLEQPQACEDWTEIYSAGTILFNIAFVLEVLARVCATPLCFFLGKGHKWNYFDLGLAGGALAELTSDVGSITYLRLVRMLRMLHILRVGRVIGIFQILRRMVSSLLNSLYSLMWLILLLVLILYIFALACVQAGVQGSLLPATEMAFRRKHGSVVISMLTLFQSITGGIDWAEAMQPLSEIHPLYGFLFIFFIVLNIFAVMNVVNGVFVNQALEIAQFDRDLVIHEHVVQAQRNVRNFENLFSKKFQNAGGITDRDSLIAVLNDDPESLASLRMMGIDCSPECLQELVAYFDFSGGPIDVTDFVRCCQRVQGPAKSIDLLDLRSRIEELSEQLRLNGISSLHKRRPLPDLSKLPNHLPDGTWAITDLRKGGTSFPVGPSHKHSWQVR